jgi:TRAP-type C4-dicarboxylate transport system permease large subunit
MIPMSIAGMMQRLPESPLLFLIISNILFVIFGALLDGVAALLLFLPILMPVATTLHIDRLHFAITSIASLGLGVIIPPIGILLLVVCGITKAPVAEVSRYMAPYITLRVACLLLLIVVPWITLALPQSFGF